MKAGRELDALVAEKVMGKFLHPTVRTCYNDGPAMATAGPDPEQFPNSELHCEWGSVPNYSTDIAAAWGVVERLGCNLFQLHHDTRYGVDGKTGWSVVLDGSVLCEFVATAPLAICLAALKAVGYEQA